MSSAAEDARQELRPRVDAILRQAWQHRLTLVSAGTGFGKSTALAMLDGADGEVVRLTIGARDRDLHSLSRRIASAAGITGWAFESDRVAGVDDVAAMAEARAAALCDGLATRTEPLLLILDDVDLLAADTDAAAFVRGVCLQAPPGLHIVLSGRDRIRAELGAVAGRGDVLEIGAADLAFTAAEIGALYRTRFGSAPDEQIVRRCHRITAGWPSAVRLVLDELADASYEDGIDTAAVSESGRWRRFAEHVLAGEAPAVRNLLGVLAVVGGAGAELLAAVDGSADELDLADLAERGLLVRDGDGRSYRLSPVLEHAARGTVAPPEAARVAASAATWLERGERYAEALQLRAGGPAAELRDFLLRRGDELIADGAGRRVADVLTSMLAGMLADGGTGGDGALEGLLAQALWTAGDWDGAVEHYGRAQRCYHDRQLPASQAWRFGALLYLRGDVEGAVLVLTGAREGNASNASNASNAGDVDDALVAAWLASAHWSRGSLDEARSSCERARLLAASAGSARASAAAYVAAALIAAANGDRDENERCYRAASAAARVAGDTVQAARIHANLASKALEEGNYRNAVEQADTALEIGAGHRFFTGLALGNKAEALLRTGSLADARACAAESVDAYAACGSLLESGPHLILAEIYLQRGDAVQARLSAERAARMAQKADDAQILVKAWSVLTWLLALDDPDSAASYARQAVARATSLGRAQALNALAWARLCAGDDAEASSSASQAEREARSTDDRPSLAAALELRAAAAGDRRLLAESIAVWDAVGEPIALARARFHAALLDDDALAMDAARSSLSAHGAALDVGVVRLLGSHRSRDRTPVITTLGRFSLTVDGESVPAGAWQSRKARDLVKLLASRRGQPMSRDAVADALWPDADPAALANRLSVALSVVRRVLDPQRRCPPDHFVVADGRSIGLRVDRVRLDVAEFFEAVDAATAQRGGGAATQVEAALRRADSLYAGDFLDEDRFEDWAIECREQARSASLGVARHLAHAATQRGADDEATGHLLRLLERDPYDEAAWTELVASLVRLRRHGEARRTYARYVRRMAELEVDPVSFEQATHSRP